MVRVLAHSSYSSPASVRRKEKDEAMRFCPCFGSDEAKAIADRDPVLLVSGMGGSIVNSKPKTFGFTTRVWVRLLLADLEFRKKIWSHYNPKTGPTSTSSLSTISEFWLSRFWSRKLTRTLRLLWNVGQEVWACGPWRWSWPLCDRYFGSIVGQWLIINYLTFNYFVLWFVLVAECFSCVVWQFTKCVHLTEVYHFHDMIEMLVGCGYEKGTTLFGFGYDFRQSNR